MTTARDPGLTALGPNEPERILLVHERYRIAGSDRRLSPGDRSQNPAGPSSVNRRLRIR